MAGFRRLVYGEAFLYRDHLLRLDSDSRYARFSGTVSNGTIANYCKAIEWNNTAIIGFFDNDELHGAAEIRYERKLFPKSAELAFSVERGYQSTRVGTQLMKRTLTIMQNRGIVRAHIVCLLANSRMQRLALRHRANTQAASGEVFMTIDVPRPDLGSLAVEATDSYLGWLLTGIDMIKQAVPKIGAARAL